MRYRVEFFLTSLARWKRFGCKFEADRIFPQKHFLRTHWLTSISITHFSEHKREICLIPRVISDWSGFETIIQNKSWSWCNGKSCTAAMFWDIKYSTSWFICHYSVSAFFGGFLKYTLQFPRIEIVDPFAMERITFVKMMNKISGINWQLAETSIVMIIMCGLQSY